MARPRPGASRRGAAYTGDATSTRRHSALASCIWRGVAHETRTRAGDATTSATQRARDVATFSRLSEYRNSMPRGASSGDDDPIA